MQHPYKTSKKGLLGSKKTNIWGKVVFEVEAGVGNAPTKQAKRVFLGLKNLNVWEMAVFGL